MGLLFAIISGYTIREIFSGHLFAIFAQIKDIINIFGTDLFTGTNSSNFEKNNF